MARKNNDRKVERGDGSFRVTPAGNLEYRISYKDEDGVSRRKSFTGIDETECLMKAQSFRKKLALINKGLDINATMITILEARYKKDLNMGFTGEQGYCRNMGNVKVLKKSEIAKIPIRDVTRRDVTKYLESLSKYSSSMVKQFYRQVKLAFSIAEEQGLIEENFMTSRDMKCPKIGKPVKKVSALSPEDQKKLVDKMTTKTPPYGRNDYRLQLFIELYSGMRMGEINALHPEDIDLDNNVIHVRGTISRGLDYREFVKESTKTEAGVRDIPISSKLRPYLEEALSRKKDNSENLVFYDYNKNSVISTTQVNCYYQRICRDAGIPADGQHSLRHTFATRCIESGIPPVVLKNWLGHTDIHITLDTYTDVFKAMDNNAVSTFDQYIDMM